MLIFTLVSITILAIFLILKKVFQSAKRNLYKDQAAWSGKEINIKHIKTKERSASKTNKNYLKIIADESKFYLEDQSEQ